MNNLELRSIEDIQNMSFFIPDYQRGYRWTPRQVEDLLDDVAEFYLNGSMGIYCVQPLVIVEKKDKNVLEQIKAADDIDTIKKLLKGMWEVVDGQQRLTTIKLILQAFGLPSYSIEYETRAGSAIYIEQLGDNYESNIDYYHMWDANRTIKKWIECHKDIDKSNFTKVLLRQVKFIWYETTDTNPKEVFARLNIGKIALTNAELVKALLLNKSNFNQYVSEESCIKALQQEIAMQWDNIEYVLQSREFWLFLNNIGDERPTRIELIFYLIAKNDLLKCGYDEGVDEHKDDYYTFRYFYRFMSQQVKNQKPKNEIIEAVWEQVMEIYQTLKEWYDDMELYHYIGFLICCRNKSDYLYTLYKKWNDSIYKSTFKDEILSEVKNNLKNTDIETATYDLDNGPSKRKCYPILLLHNVQTVINRNRILLKNEKYSAGVFYKFPFHLLKSENWDIEHIDSNTENGLSDIRSQREWLLNAYFGLYGDEYSELRDKIQTFFTTYQAKDNEDNVKEQRDKDFESLREQVEDVKVDDRLRLSQEEKNKIWNFTLLDRSTNRSYRNAIYPAKRRVIIGKEQGKKYALPTLDEHGNIIEAETTEGQSSFIPPCAKNVFMKFYNTNSFDPNVWNRTDADAYLQDIKETLKQFLS